MKEYIFYTQEGTTYPPQIDKEIDNCQILGVVCGENAENARKRLEEQSPWIKDCGFDINEAVSKQILTDNIKKEINKLIDYLIEDEYRNYKELGEPKEHIYNTLLRLKALVD